MSDTVGLMFVDESSSRYPEFVNTKNNLISMGVQHDPQTLTQFIFYLHTSCTIYPSLDPSAFLIALIKMWNEYKSLDVLSSCEKFYTTGSFND